MFHNISSLTHLKIGISEIPEPDQFFPPFYILFNNIKQILVSV